MSAARAKLIGRSVGIAAAAVAVASIFAARDRLLGEWYSLALRRASGEEQWNLAWRLANSGPAARAAAEESYLAVLQGAEGDARGDDAAVDGLGSVSDVEFPGPRLLALANTTERKVKAAQRLAELGSERAIDPLARILDDIGWDDPLLILGARRQPDGPPAHARYFLALIELLAVARADTKLVRIVRDATGPDKFSTFKELAEVGKRNQEALRFVCELILDARLPSRIRQMAAKAVRDSKLDGDRAIDALFAALSDGDGIVRYYALDALRSVGGAAVIAALTDRLVNDRHTGVRQTAALGLGEVGAAARPAIPALRKALADENHLVRKYADAALLRLGSNPRSTAFDPGPR